MEERERETSARPARLETCNCPDGYPDVKPEVLGPQSLGTLQGWPGGGEPREPAHTELLPPCGGDEVGRARTPS